MLTKTYKCTNPFLHMNTQIYVRDKLGNRELHDNNSSSYNTFL